MRVEYSNQKWIKVEKDESYNVVYKIPYSSIKDGVNCPKVENNFIVYILHGITVDSKDYIYVGKSTKGLENRPSSHESKYDKWSYCYVLTRKDSKFFNDGVIQYLEDTIRRRVDECSDYYIDTTDKTSSNTANERDIRKSNEYLLDIYDRLMVLGLDLNPKQSTTRITDFGNAQKVQGSSGEKKPETEVPSTEKIKPVAGQYHLRSKHIRAMAIIRSEKEVIVLAGSEVSPSVQNNFEKHNYYKLRLDLHKEGIIKDGKFVVDYTFKSPSAAAAVTLGRAANGKIEWIDENGKPFSS